MYTMCDTFLPSQPRNCNESLSTSCLFIEIFYFNFVFREIYIAFEKQTNYETMRVLLVQIYTPLFFLLMVYWCWSVGGDSWTKQSNFFSAESSKFLFVIFVLVTFHQFISAGKTIDIDTLLNNLF